MEARQRRRRVVGRPSAVGALVALLLVGLVLAAPVAPAGAAPVSCADGSVADAAGSSGPDAEVADPACPPTTDHGALARSGPGLGALAAIGLTLVAIAAVLTGERRRPRRRTTDPRTRDRIASLIDRTP